MTTAIETAALTKFYADRPVVAGIDLEVGSGTMFGFLGPNGAGKSTTVGMLATMIRPTAGTARVAGVDVVADPFEVRRRVSIVFQETTLDEDLSAQENLRFQARLLGLSRAEARQRIEECLDVVGLSSSAGVRVSQLSGGMRRRLELARGIIARPEVLFLDEPTTGLDPQTRRNVWEHLHGLVRDAGCTIFLTTHHLEEAEVCDEVAIIDHGRIITRGAPTVLKSQVGSDRVSVVPDGDPRQSASWLGSRFGEVENRDSALVFRASDSTHALQVLFTEAPFLVKELTVTTPSLDDVFLLHTGSEMRDRQKDTITTDMIGGPS